MTSTRVAMRTGSSTVNFLLGDHLNSNAITTDSSGMIGSEIRYTPWGTRRYASGSILTLFQFTSESTEILQAGQRIDGDLGLYDYGARWSPGKAPGTARSGLGRFLQADTIVPGGAGAGQVRI